MVRRLRRNDPEDNYGCPLERINGIQHQLYECELYNKTGDEVALRWKPKFLQKHGPRNNIEYNGEDFRTTNDAKITAFVFLPVRRDLRQTSGHRSKILHAIEEAITAGRFPEDFVPLARELVRKMRILHYKYWLNK